MSVLPLLLLVSLWCCYWCVCLAFAAFVVISVALVLFYVVVYVVVVDAGVPQLKIRKITRHMHEMKVVFGVL